MFSFPGLPLLVSVTGSASHTACACYGRKQRFKIRYFSLTCLSAGWYIVILQAVPALLQKFLDADPKVKAYFDGLAPSRRRDFSDHISNAKQETTKLRRLEKVKGLLLQKKGLHDKYKNC